MAIRCAQGHVDDVDGVVHAAVIVRVERSLDGFDNRDAAARGRHGTAHFIGDERRARRDADVFSVLAAPGDDVRDVRAVPLEVDRIRVGLEHVARIAGPGLTDEVIAVDDFLGREEAIARLVLGVRGLGAIGGGIGCCGSCASEVAVCVVHTRVEHCNADAGSVVTERLSRGGSDVRHGLAERDPIVDNFLHARHAGKGGQRRQRAGVDANDHGVVGDADARDLLAAERQHLAQHIVLLLPDLLGMCDLLPTIQKSALAARVLTIRDGERRIGQLHDDIHRPRSLQQRRVQPVQRQAVLQRESGRRRGADETPGIRRQGLSKCGRTQRGSQEQRSQERGNGRFHPANLPTLRRAVSQSGVRAHATPAT